MCARLDQHEDVEWFAAHLDAIPTAHADRFAPRWNLAPSQHLLFVAPWRGQRRLGAGIFGHGKARTTSAAVEMLPTNWSAMLRTGRCVVPVDGWYEWEIRGEHDRTPYHHQAAEGLTLLAGLWHRRGGGVEVVIVTRPTDDGTAKPVHDRMPLLLREGEVDTWLQGDVEDAMALTTSRRPRVESFQVGPDVENWKNQGPRVGEPLSFRGLPRRFEPEGCILQPAADGCGRPPRQGSPDRQ
jgi:putative SOS response-associated peptidase YedK